MRNHSYENDFDLHENETARRTHFHMKGFANRLVLKQRHLRTRKWPIAGVEKISSKTCGCGQPRGHLIRVLNERTEFFVLCVW